MKKILTLAFKIAKDWYKYWVKFLTIFGDIKIYKTPCWVIYDPSEYDYKVHGNAIRQIEKVIEPGDIVLRKYDHYLDGMVIPGEYSHSGIYVGDNKVIHAIAEGVSEIDIIDFFQCDKACVLRPNVNQELKDRAIARAKKWVGTDYDFKFNSSDSSAFYCNELSATCYKDIIDIKPTTPIFFGKQLKFVSPKYLAESFLTNSNFTKIIEK